MAAPLDRWLNVELGLRQTAALPEVDRLRVGRLPLPAALAMPLLRAWLRVMACKPTRCSRSTGSSSVTIDRGQLMVSYRIGPDTASRLRAALVAPADQQRLRAYTEAWPS